MKDMDSKSLFIGIVIGFVIGLVLGILLEATLFIV
jgi:gas vesicle protein